MDVAALVRLLRDGDPSTVRVRDWSLHASTSRRLVLGIKDRELGNAHAPLQVTESGGVRYLLVWEDGLVSRGSFEAAQIDPDPGVGLRLAREAAYPDADAAAVLGPADMPEVALHDPAVAALARGEIDHFVRRLDFLKQRLDAHGARTWSGSFSAAEGELHVQTSAGLESSYRVTSTGWSISLNGEVGEGFGARTPEPDADYRGRIERLLDTARRLERSAPPIAGGLHPVLLHPRVVEQYVLGTLLQNLDGGTVAHGDGHFRREQFGSDQPVLREDVNLHILPLLPMRSGSYRFTIEGLPAAPYRFVEGGRLVCPVLDLKYARRLGLAPTPLPSATDTIFFEGAPPIELDQALGLAAGGALVFSVLGVHTQDSASGDFSLAAPHALRIDTSGITGRERLTIAGNLFEILQDPELAWVHFPGEHSPGLLVRCRLDPGEVATAPDGA